MALTPLDPWEALWAPYDEATYAAVLAAVAPDDIVLDIGAGDLRLARRLAGRVRRVIAWEINPDLLAAAAAQGPFPANLLAVAADARRAALPPDLTAAVLLMRHCTPAHYALYTARLRAAGCRRLITNARWRMGVEVIDLAPALPLESAPPGWYTCRRCGAIGFLPPELVDDGAAAVDRVTDVEGCPSCLIEREGIPCSFRTSGLLS